MVDVPRANTCSEVNGMVDVPRAHTTGPNCYCSVDAVLAGVADHRGQDTLVNGSAAGGSTAADASNLVHRHFAGSARCLLLIVGLVPTVALLLYWLFDFRLSTFRLCRL